jgi:ElaB/YqjD/DUF883 family membrane-anchored ribosome-binding protein
MSIILSIVTDANLKGVKKAIKEFESLKTNGEKASLAISKAALPAAAAVAGLAAAGLSAAKAAADEELAMKKLATQIRNSTTATDAQISANEDFVAQLQYTAAVSDDELRPALSTLVTATKDVSHAQRLLQTALNVSAATGQDLGSVSEALSRGFSGNMRSLAALSPELKTAIKNGADFSDVLKILESNFGGASDAAANTASGSLKKMQIALDDAQETIGMALVPYLAEFAKGLQKAATFVRENTPLVIGFAIGVGGLATALLAAKAAMVVYNTIAAITTAANTALAISGFAVQIATGVGIATAIAGAAALVGLTVMVRNATKAQGAYATATNQAAEETGYLKVQIDKAREAGDRARQAEAAGIAAAEKAKAASDKARQAAKNLFDATSKAIEQGKQSLREYAGGLADAVRGWVSLSSAVAGATDSEDKYQDALKERVDAYAELNKLQKDGVYTQEQMADATERVAKAEAGVNTAQSQRKTYSQAFAEQIAAAKKFGGQLQQLIQAGLGRSGLAQLMNLGPVAGSQVAGDILAGTGGLSVASLNADLSAIDAAGAALGTDAIAGDMAYLDAASVNRRGNTVSITVQAGLVSTPDQVGQQIIEAILKAQRRSGLVFAPA